MPLIRAYYQFSAIWFSFVAPLCGACAGFVVVEDLLPFLGWIIAPFTAGVICFGAAIAVSVYGIWNASHLRVTRVAVTLPNLPDAWRGKRLVFFADAHLGNVRGKGFVEKIVKKVEELDPAVVAICGDMFDGMKCDAEQYVESPQGTASTARGLFRERQSRIYPRERILF